MDFFFLCLGFSAGYPKVTKATTFHLAGMFSNCFTFSSLKSPIQQEPMPNAHAPTTMFCKEIAVSIVAHFPVNRSFGLAQPTITTGEFLRKRLNNPFDNCFFYLIICNYDESTWLSVSSRRSLSPCLNYLIQYVRRYVFLLVTPYASATQDKINWRHELEG